MELPEVVTVNRDVVCIVVTRIGARVGGGISSCGVVCVCGPDPLDVGHAHSFKNRHNVAVGGCDVGVCIELAGVTYGPRIPIPAVGFVKRAEPHLMRITLHGCCKLCDVGVGLAVVDVRCRVIVGLPGHEQGGAVVGGDVGIGLHAVPRGRPDGIVFDVVDGASLQLHEGLYILVGWLRVAAVQARVAGATDPRSNLESRGPRSEGKRQDNRRDLSGLHRSSFSDPDQDPHCVMS